MNGNLYAGAARGEVTPGQDLLPFLFGLAGQTFDRIRDPLFVRVLALRAGEDVCLLIVFDLDKAPYPEEWTEVIETKTGVPRHNIFFLSIHTHTAPLTGYRPDEGPNFILTKPENIQVKVREYEDFIFTVLLKTVKTALSAMVPARTGYAFGKSYIGVNRCVKYFVRHSDGSIRPEMGLGANPAGIANPALFVLRIEDKITGKPIAFLTNYGMHCCAAFLNNNGTGKSFISADIAGEINRTLEKEYSNAVSFWTSAPAGDINPSMMVQTFYPDPDTGAPREVDLPGERIADLAVIEMAARQLADIRRTLRAIRCDTEELSVRSAVEYAALKCCRLQDRKSGCRDDYRIRLHFIQAGKLYFIGVNGELYTSLGKIIEDTVRKYSPGSDVVIFNHEASLLAGSPGYILDDNTLFSIAECSDFSSDESGIPGHEVYTEPGTTGKALQETVKKMILSLQ